MSKIVRHAKDWAQILWGLGDWLWDLGCRFRHVADSELTPYGRDNV